MPWGLKRFHKTGQLHFITFSCYRRRPKLGTARARNAFELALEQARQRYGFSVTGYVVMPEHVHLLVSEPERGTLAVALKAMKQSVERQFSLRAREPFWQARYYDFNVWSTRKRIEKLRYMHRNPVKRGLVQRPEDWKWRTGGPGNVTYKTNTLEGAPSQASLGRGRFSILATDLIFIEYSEDHIFRLPNSIRVHPRLTVPSPKAIKPPTDHFSR